MNSLQSYQLVALPITRKKISRKAYERLDLMLLAIEAIDIKGHQVIISAVEALGLEKDFPNLVEVWKFRCQNPLRKTPERAFASNEKIHSLIILLSFLSDYFYPRIRQLLSSKEPADENEKRWNEYKLRLNDLISERMNTGRAAIKRYLQGYDQSFYKDLIIGLALSSGTGGVHRLHSSLLDTK